MIQSTKTRNHSCDQMAFAQLISSMVLLYICGKAHGNGIPMGIGQRLTIHHRPCEAHVLRVIKTEIWEIFNQSIFK